MSIQWETYPPSLTWMGKENEETVVCIQVNPPESKFAFNGVAEVWGEERDGKVTSVQLYADGNDVVKLKQVLLEWREKFKAMMAAA